MEDHPRPRTVEEILALPEFAFGISERVIDGVTYRVPTQPAVMCVFHDAHDPMLVRNEDGYWTLGRYADGRWYRRRIAL